MPRGKKGGKKAPTKSRSCTPEPPSEHTETPEPEASPRSEQSHDGGECATKAPQERGSTMFHSARSSALDPVKLGVDVESFKHSLRVIAADLAIIGTTDEERACIFERIHVAIAHGVDDATRHVDALVQEEQTLFEAALNETQQMRVAVLGHEAAEAKLSAMGEPLDGTASMLPAASAGLPVVNVAEEKPEAGSVGNDPVIDESENMVDDGSDPFTPASRRSVAPRALRSMREIRQSLILEKTELCATADSRIELFACVADAFSKAVSSLDEARSAIESDARIHDDVLGATASAPATYGVDEAPRDATQLPAILDEADLAGESRELSAEQIRQLRYGQDLTEARLHRMAEAVKRLQTRVDNAAELRVQQQRRIVFDRLYVGVNQAAVAASAQRSSFSTAELDASISTIRDARASKLDHRLRKIHDGLAADVARDLPGDFGFAAPQATSDGRLPSESPQCVVDLFKPSTATCAVKLEAVRAEERFALNMLCQFKALKLASLIERHAAQRAAFFATTHDGFYGTPLSWAADIPTRFRHLMSTASSVGGVDGDAVPADAATSAVAQLQGDVLDDVATPVTTILEEIELVDACIVDATDAIAQLAAATDTVAQVLAPFRRRQALLADASKYNAASDRERMLSRKASAASEMMAAAKWKQQMKDVLPLLEKTIVDALAEFDERFPKRQDVHPITIDGVVLRNEEFSAFLAAKEAEASHHIPHAASSRQGSVAPTRGAAQTSRAPSLAVTPVTPRKPSSALVPSRSVNAAAAARKLSCTPSRPAGDKRARSIAPAPASPAPHRSALAPGLPPPSKRQPTTSRSFAGASQAPPRTPARNVRRPDAVAECAALDN